METIDASPESAGDFAGPLQVRNIHADPVRRSRGSIEGSGVNARTHQRAGLQAAPRLYLRRRIQIGENGQRLQKAHVRGRQPARGELDALRTEAMLQRLLQMRDRVDARPHPLLRNGAKYLRSVAMVANSSCTGKPDRLLRKRAI